MERDNVFRWYGLGRDACDRHATVTFAVRRSTQSFPDRYAILEFQYRNREQQLQLLDGAPICTWNKGWNLDEVAYPLWPNLDPELSCVGPKWQTMAGLWGIFNEPLQFRGTEEAVSSARTRAFIAILEHVFISLWTVCLPKKCSHICWALQHLVTLGEHSFESLFRLSRLAVLLSERSESM